MEPLLLTSLALWAGALAVGAADGLYFHLWKFRLYARPQSRTEHLTHTIRACLLAPMLYVAFVAPALTVLLVLVALDSATALSDVWIENESRRDLGGMPRFEYLVHVTATALHSAAVAFAVAFWWHAGSATAPALVRDGGLALVAASLPVALLHVVLVFWRPAAPRVEAPPAA